MSNQKDMPTEQEINRKRKNSGHDFQIPRKFSFDINEPEEDNDFLNLSLAFHPTATRPRKLSPVRQQQQQQQPAPPAPPPLPSPPPPSSSSLPPTPVSMQSFFSKPLTPQHPLQLSTTTHPFNYLPALPVPALPQTADSSSSLSPYRQESAGSSRPSRQRRNPSHTPREGKSETVPIPYPWATDHRATIHSLKSLLSRQILKVSGEVQCKKCERQYQMDYDLREKFLELWRFIAENKSSMHDRAPGVWMNPVLPTCKFCDQENSVKPIISDKKKSINWLFLLLGQMLGCCTLEQLKYFCKHTKNHRTGAKDRVLYLTYLSLCKQLDPSGPFDR